MKLTLLVIATVLSSFSYAQSSGRCQSGMNVLTESEELKAETTSFLEKRGYQIRSEASCRLYLNTHKTKKGLVVKSALYDVKKDEIYLLSFNEYQGSSEVETKRLVETSLRKLNAKLSESIASTGLYHWQLIVLPDMPNTLNANTVTTHLRDNN